MVLLYVKGTISLWDASRTDSLIQWIFVFSFNEFLNLVPTEIRQGEVRQIVILSPKKYAIFFATLDCRGTFKEIELEIFERIPHGSMKCFLLGILLEMD